MKSTQVVIIGAGPAGATAACLLARRGVRVLLTDRAAFPRQKLCGGCLAQTGYELLAGHALSDLPSLQSPPLIDRLDVCAPSRSLRLRVPPYRVINRARFDQDLVNAAIDSGARFLHPIRAAVGADLSVVLTDPDGDRRTMDPPVVIIADGIKGTALRGAPGFGWRVSSSARVGIGGVLAAMPLGCAADAITMLQGAPGYAGIAPLEDGRAIVAAAVDPAWIGRSHDAPLPIALLRALGLQIDPRTPITMTAGAPGLTRSRQAIESSERVFLIGDATGYVEPFTGEGMSWSLQDACMIARHAIGVLTRGYVNGEWTRQHRSVNRRRHMLCRASAKLLRHTAITNGLIWVSSSVPALAGAISGAVGFLQHRDPTESGIA